MTIHTKRFEQAWLIFWSIASVAVAVNIFFLSAQTSSESNELSLSVMHKLLALLLGKSPEWVALRYNRYIRKAAHFWIYTLLGFCLMGAFRHQERVAAPPAAIITASFYAATDELHQAFVPGRGPQVTDVLLDTCGAAFGVYLMILALRLLLWGMRKCEASLRSR